MGAIGLKENRLQSGRSLKRWLQLPGHEVMEFLVPRWAWSCLAFLQMIWEMPVVGWSDFWRRDCVNKFDDSKREREGEGGMEREEIRGRLREREERT